MTTNQTSNYQLNQWEPTDAVQRVDFNADNAKLDAALKNLSDQIIQKASLSALNTLITAMNQKVDYSDLAALSEAVAQKAEQSALNTLSSAVQQLQNALTKIAFGVYTGDGTTYRTISLGYTPKAVFVTNSWGAVSYHDSNYQLCGGLVLPDHPVQQSTSFGTYPALKIVEGGFQVGYTSGQVSLRTNVEGETYHYIAFYE